MLKAVASLFGATVLTTCSADNLLAADIVANQQKAAADQSVWSGFRSEHQPLSLIRGGALGALASSRATASTLPRTMR
jgi:hypothetical protein